MAKKAAPRKPRKTIRDLPRHILDAALELAALQGWRDTTLADVAEAAKLPLGKVLAVYPSKAAMVSAFARTIDAKVLEADDPDLAGQPPRDRLFDVMMRRFDALGPHKEATRAIVGATLCDPAAAVCGAFVLRRSMALMLEAAHIGSPGVCGGVRGMLRVKGLAAIHLAVLRVWFSDDSDDMTRTMAALDKRLRQAESLVMLCRLAGRRRAAPEADAESA
ncbi:MAG: TetR family transcriptional regulator [Alphaproteobacteria bacterium]